MSLSRACEFRDSDFARVIHMHSISLAWQLSKIGCDYSNVRITREACSLMYTLIMLFINRCDRLDRLYHKKIVSVKLFPEQLICISRFLPCSRWWCRKWIVFVEIHQRDIVASRNPLSPRSEWTEYVAEKNTVVENDTAHCYS